MTLWQIIQQHILRPAKLSSERLWRLFFPLGRNGELRRHAGQLILGRVRLLAAIFALAVPLGSVVDFLVYDARTAGQLCLLRLASAAVFLLLAWPRAVSLTRPYMQALLHLFVFLLVPSLFHLLSLDLLQAASHTRTQLLVSQLYAYLPTVVLGGLAIFPLTALETLFFAIPVLLLTLGSLLFGPESFDLLQHGGSLWFMAIMLGVAMFSGMSQYHYMHTLVVRAMHDPLTGAYTRQSGEEALRLLFRINRLADQPLSILFIDLDHFKRINDEFGHEAGDLCLRMMAEKTSRSLRRSDLLIRWGGEEFIAVLPNTSLDKIDRLLQRLRQDGLGQRPDGQAVTASIGVAHSQEVGVINWHGLIQRADQRMYAAKQKGRDGVVWPDGKRQSLTPSDGEFVAGDVA